MEQESGGLMREIKFRAWDSESNTMISWEHMSDNVAFYMLPTHLELMQYTGFTNMLGQSFYEGDICKSDLFGTLMVIVYDHTRMAFVLQPVTSCKCNKRPPIGYIAFRKTLKGLKLIGNIHENPELLEAK